MVRHCDVCGIKDAHNDVLGTDLCGGCAPNIKKAIKNSSVWGRLIEAVEEYK